jgi:hypothetical protein
MSTLPTAVDGHQGLAQRLGVAGRDDVEHARREADLLERGGQRQHGQRRQLGGLDDHRAAGRDGGPDLAGAHGEREVPRGDEQAGTDRLADRQQPAASGRRLHPAAVDADGLLGEPPEELRAVGDLPLRLLDRLAHLEAHQLGEVVGPLGDQLERATKDLAALAWRRRPPLLLDLHGRVQRVDRVVDVPVGDVGDDGAVGGVTYGERGAAVGLAPGPADEEPAVLGDEKF